jgi:hypothetical protein
MMEEVPVITTSFMLEVWHNTVNLINSVEEIILPHEGSPETVNT